MLNKLILLLFILQFSVNAFTQTAPPKETQSTQTENQKVVIISPSDRIDENTDLIQGKVFAVYDGDTISLQDSNNNIFSIRFQGIDAPEGKQKFGKESRQSLSDLILDKNVVVIVNKKDTYDRYLGSVYLDGQDVGLMQIKAGMAWHFKKYADEQSAVNREKYERAEREAQTAKVGLWTEDKPKPPWIYRGDIIGDESQVSPDNTSKAETSKVKDKKDNSKKDKGKKDREYILGPRGGCYYINSSGTKTYVKDKSLCNN